MKTTKKNRNGKYVYAQVALKRDDDQDIISWRNRVDNWSDYVKRLVRADIAARAAAR